MVLSESDKREIKTMITEAFDDLDIEIKDLKDDVSDLEDRVEKLEKGPTRNEIDIIERDVIHLMGRVARLEKLKRRK